MIVRTLLDTDLYKFTTSYAYIKLFPYAMLFVHMYRRCINWQGLMRLLPRKA